MKNQIIFIFSILFLMPGHNPPPYETGDNEGDYSKRPVKSEVIFINITW